MPLGRMLVLCNDLKLGKLKGVAATRFSHPCKLNEECALTSSRLICRSRSRSGGSDCTSCLRSKTRMTFTFSRLGMKKQTLTEARWTA